MFGRSKGYLAAIAASVISAATTQVAAQQNLPGIFNILGGIIDAAIVDTARREWGARPQRDYDCLSQQRVAVSQLVARGIGPNDPRVRQFFSQCSALAAKPAPLVESTANSKFVIDGLTLGSTVLPQQQGNKYACHASEEFAGFTWCATHRSEGGKYGPETIWVSVLQSSTNEIVYITQSIEPAFFASSDIDNEIRRLSRDFGEEGKVLTASSQSGGWRGVIASWGAVTLERLDESTMDALRRGVRNIHKGLLADFLGEPHKSARAGLPVFSIGGGVGYIWDADFGEGGKGSLRITAVNAGTLGSSNFVTAPQPPVQPVPAPEPPQPSPEDQARLQREQADRLARDEAAANNKVDEVAQFIKEHDKNPKLSDYVEHVVSLRTAMEKNDPDVIEKELRNLETQLNDDKEYMQFIAQRTEQRKRDEARYLAEFVQLATQQDDFIKWYITNNVKAAPVIKLAPFIKQLEIQIATPNLEQLRDLTSRVNVELSNSDLYNQFEDRRSKPLVSEPAPTTPSQTLPETERNSFLLSGDLGDVVILYNSRPDAPHIAINLRGDYVFSTDSAHVCLFGQNPEDVALNVNAALAAYRLKEISGVDERCDVRQLASYDLIAMQRGVFLSSSAADALAVIKDIEAGALRKFSVLTAQEISAREKAEQDESSALEKDLDNDARSGYGVILLKTRSPSLCFVVNMKERAHRQLVLRNADKLALRMQVTPALVPKTAEEAFVGAQKAQCGAVYAGASDLKALSAGLKREKIPFVFSTIWITPEELDTEAARLAEAARLEAQKETERKQRAEDEEALRKQRDKDAQRDLEDQQQKLRKEYDGPAHAAVSSIVSEVSAVIADPNGNMAAFYPNFSNWWSDMKAKYWVIVSTNSDVEDYGKADFKGRKLDGALARFSIHLKNSVLGEYQDACFIFGHVADPEFNSNREPLDAKCEDYQDIGAWKVGHNFQSLWTPNGDQQAQAGTSGN